MSQFAHLIALEVVTCWRCGVAYAVPATYLETKINRGRAIHCPNGHENGYGRKAADEQAGEVKAERDKLRDERLQLLHKLEQAEARATEVTPSQTVESPETPEVPARVQELPAPIAADPNVVTYSQVDEGGWKCDKCGKIYYSGGSGWLERHARKAHDWQGDCPRRYFLADDAATK